MNLRQLRYFVEIERQGLNLSAAAAHLFTSQPGVSRQIRDLEQELGVELFQRRGRRLARLTAAGADLLPLAQAVIAGSEEVRRVAAEHADPESGQLSIATTHTQARYALPAAVARFTGRHPRVELRIHQGTPDQLAELAAREEVDVVIATEGLERFGHLTLLPCYRWNRSALVPRGHPLAQQLPLTLPALAQYPLVTYVFAVGGHRLLTRAFERQGLRPRVALTAVDTGVIKTYVRLGLGVGIIASMAHQPERDDDLLALPAAHLFPDSETMVGLPRDRRLRRHVVEFIGLFAPHLDAAVIARAQAGPPGVAAGVLAPGFELPRR